MNNSQDLILSELRLIREDFNRYARDTGERIASLETDMHGILGNGQPGRLGLMERVVAKLSQRMWWAIGAAAGGSTVISVVAWVVMEMRK